MLRIIGERQEEPAVVRADEYVPLDARIGALPLDPLYWRAKDGAEGLVEVGIDSQSGRLSSFSVVTVARRGRLRGTSWPAIQPTSGVPVVDLSPWAGRDLQDYGLRFIDEEQRISVSATDSRLGIWIDDVAQVVRMIRAGALVFGIDHDARLRFVGAELPASEFHAMSRGLFQL